ncbi:Dephospho-CoA kinase [Chlamydiales bacterium STE3]|nr:Dephospho-CoA kinase [Chlamydiales bacterium STE3]
MERMLNLLKVAVTGGLSSGKSTVCQIFRGLGAHVVSADEIVHQLLSPDTCFGQEVIKLLGVEIVIDKMIDRKSIANKVFKNPQLLHQIEKILHPAVFTEMKKGYQSAKASSSPLFVAEVPLLIEAHQDSWFDVVIAVLANEETSRKRFVESTGFSEEEYRLRMSRQLTPSQKAEKAHYIIFNDGDFTTLENQVHHLYHNLTQS